MSGRGHREHRRLLQFPPDQEPALWHLARRLRGDRQGGCPRRGPLGRHERSRGSRHPASRAAPHVTSQVSHSEIKLPFGVGLSIWICLWSYLWIESIPVRPTRVCGPFRSLTPLRSLTPPSNERDLDFLSHG